MAADAVPTPLDPDSARELARIERELALGETACVRRIQLRSTPVLIVFSWSGLTRPAFDWTDWIVPALWALYVVFGVPRDARKQFGLLAGQAEQLRLGLLKGIPRDLREAGIFQWTALILVLCSPLLGIILDGALRQFAVMAMISGCVLALWGTVKATRIYMERASSLDHTIMVPRHAAHPVWAYWLASAAVLIFAWVGSNLFLR